MSAVNPSGSTFLYYFTELLPKKHLLRVYQQLDASSLYSLATTCKMTRFTHLADNDLIQLIVGDCMLSWIDAYPKNNYPSKEEKKIQKKHVAEIFKVLLLFPERVLLPELGDRTIPLFQKMFGHFEEQVSRHLGCLYRKNIFALQRKYATESEDGALKVKKFLYHMPTAYSIGITSVVGINEICRRYDQGVLFTKRDEKWMHSEYERNIVDCDDEFKSDTNKWGGISARALLIHKASIPFLQKVFKDYSTGRVDGAKTNCFFFDDQMQKALVKLFHKDLKEFQNKFAVCLDFYEHHLRYEGGKLTFECAQYQTQRELLETMLRVLVAGGEVTALISYKFKFWVDALKNQAREECRWYKQSLERKTTPRFSREELTKIYSEIGQLEACIPIVEELNQLPSPKPLTEEEKAAPSLFTVNLGADSYFFRSRLDVAQHAKYFSKLENFAEAKNEESFELTLPEGMGLTHFQTALQYLEGKEISIDETSWYDLLAVSEYLQIPRLSLMCQKVGAELILKGEVEIGEEAMKTLPPLLAKVAVAVAQSARPAEGASQRGA